MDIEKAKGPGYEDLQYRLYELLDDMVAEFQQGKPLSWPLVPKEQLSGVWSNYVRDGYVRNKKALDCIFATIRDNVTRLEIATILAGHEAEGPESFLSEYDLSENEQARFCDWVVDSEHGWRISDYGRVPMQDAVALAFEATSYGSKLKYLDRAIHVTHMRGDLSLLFIEGGRKTLLDIEYCQESSLAA